MNRRFGAFWGLILAPVSPAFYRDVAREWDGIGARYVLLLLCVVWLPILANEQRSFRRFVDAEFADNLDHLPEMSIRRGKITSPATQPYTVVDPRNGKVFFVLDTTEKINSLKDTTAAYLLTETKLFIRNSREWGVVDLKDFPDAPDIGRSVRGTLATIGNWMGVVLFPIFVLLSLIVALVLTFVDGALAFGFRRRFNPKISFVPLVRMAAMGLTLPAYVGAFLILCDVRMTRAAAIFLAVCVPTGYALFGAFAARDEEEPKANEAFVEALRKFREETAGDETKA